MSFHLWTLEKNTKVMPKIRQRRAEDHTGGKTADFPHLLITASGRLQLDSEVISLEPGKHYGSVIPTNTCRPLGRLLNQVSGLPRKQRLLLVFQRLFTQTVGAKEKRDRNKMFLSLSLSLFFFSSYERSFKSPLYGRFHLLVTKIKMTNWLPKETQKK